MEKKGKASARVGEAEKIEGQRNRIENAHVKIMLTSEFRYAKFTFFYIIQNLFWIPFFFLFPSPTMFFF